MQIIYPEWIILQLGKHREALDFAYAAQCLAPSSSEVAERVENIKKDLAAGLWLLYILFWPTLMIRLSVLCFKNLISYCFVIYLECLTYLLCFLKITCKFLISLVRRNFSTLWNLQLDD